MQLATFFLLLFSISVEAVVDLKNPKSSARSLGKRQFLHANPTVRCCENCEAKYGVTGFQEVFHDLCSWAAGKLKFTGPQTYYSGNYYCPSPFNDNVCMHIEVDYSCDADQEMTYSGCMGYFDFVINPTGTCGGPPFPGAQVVSPGKCWTFQATADKLSDFTGKNALSNLKCDPSGRWCILPKSNASSIAYTGIQREFGNPF